MCITNMIKSVWGPYRPTGHGGSVGASMGAGVAGHLVTVPAKFIGRTITLGVGFSLTALALSALAKTTVGAALGVTAFVATVSAWPLALTITGAVVAILATGLLCSYLIEKHAR